jgi:hypothetical protein
VVSCNLKLSDQKREKKRKETRQEAQKVKKNKKTGVARMSWSCHAAQ